MLMSRQSSKPNINIRSLPLSVVSSRELQLLRGKMSNLGLPLVWGKARARSSRSSAFFSVKTPSMVLAKIGRQKT